MIPHRGRLSGLLVISLLLGSASSALARPRGQPLRIGSPVGGSFESGPDAEHPSEEQRLRIEETLEESIGVLSRQGRLTEAAGARPALGWPLVPVNGLRDSGYHSTYHLVDLDPAFPDQLLDYNCGSRTFDRAIGYNHQGIDYVGWPFRWTRFEDAQLAVVAAAPGVLVFKEDGNSDYDCTTGSLLWNAVYVRHADGSVAWYGHLRNGSLTTKRVGDTVSRGEYLGLVGSSGTTSGPHLHFEVHDALNEVVEPHEGPCNGSESWWASQRPYYDSAINRLATGPALPIPLAVCPGSEAPNEATDFAPGSRIWFTAYYRDQLGPALDPAGATTRYAIYGPDGSLLVAWDHGSPADHYVGSWWSFDVLFPEDSDPGIYRWEAVYQGIVYEHWFSIGGPFAAAEVPDGIIPGAPLSATLQPGGDLALEWAASCSRDDTDFAIYEGRLGEYDTHEPVVCTTDGATTMTFTPSGESSYYLVVPTNRVWEGSYGRAADGSDRPPSTFACLPQHVGSCRGDRLPRRSGATH